MSTTVSTKASRKQLAVLWLSGSLGLLVLLVLQSLMGKYGSMAGDAWSWFLPVVMPTVSLIVGVIVYDATQPNSPDGTVERFAFNLAFLLSVAYLALVALTLLIQPFTDLKPLELMKRSNLWLAPLQGLVTAAIGIFFVRGEQK